MSVHHVHYAESIASFSELISDEGLCFNKDRSQKTLMCMFVNFMYQAYYGMMHKHVHFHSYFAAQTEAPPMIDRHFVALIDQLNEIIINMHEK